jgi:hypothetical protein
VNPIPRREADVQKVSTTLSEFIQSSKVKHTKACILILVLPQLRHFLVLNDLVIVVLLRLEDPCVGDTLLATGLEVTEGQTSNVD